MQQNAIAAGASPQIPLGSLQCSPDPLAIFKGPLCGRRGREKGEGKGRSAGNDGKGRGDKLEQGRLLTKAGLVDLMTVIYCDSSLYPIYSVIWPQITEQLGRSRRIHYCSARLPAQL